MSDIRDLSVGGSDILKRLRVLGLSGPIEAVLACDWGRRIRTEADQGQCVEQAVRRMVIHAPPGVYPEEHEYKFCQHHFDYAEELTDKHGGRTS